jgi:hypothetical protein
VSDVAVIQRDEPDAAAVDNPAQLPADAATPAQSDDLDSLLAEFDAVRSKGAEPEPEQPATDQNLSADKGGQSDFDQQIADLLRSPEDQRQIDQLTGEINNLRTAEFYRAERSTNSVRNCRGS